MIAESTGHGDGDLMAAIDELHELALQVKRDEIVEKIRQMLPSYTPMRQTLRS
jgi:hypothetical protein